MRGERRKLEAVATDHGSPFDPASVKGDETMISIKGSGAVVEE
jgi:hypothetical protein